MVRTPMQDLARDAGLHSAPIAPPPTTDRSARRRGRVQLIRDGARVRNALGQAAQYDHLDGVHVVTWQGQRFSGAAVEEGIDAARRGTR